MARLRFRALSRTIHLWIGVALFLVLAPIGVTGSYLVYDDQFDALMHPQRHAAAGPAALPPGAYVEAARQAFGDRAQPTQLRLPQGPNGGPVTVQGRTVDRLARSRHRPGAGRRRAAPGAARPDPPTARQPVHGSARPQAGGLAGPVHVRFLRHRPDHLVAEGRFLEGLRLAALPDGLEQPAPHGGVLDLRSPGLAVLHGRGDRLSRRGASGQRRPRPASGTAATATPFSASSRT